MTADRFRTLIDGTLALWQADVQAGFDADALCCRIARDGHMLAVLAYRCTPLGGAWHIDVPGRRPRTHLSIVPALAGLRDAVCPQRPHGRALFVPDATGDGTRPR